MEIENLKDEYENTLIENYISDYIKVVTNFIDDNIFNKKGSKVQKTTSDMCAIFKTNIEEIESEYALLFWVTSWQEITKFYNSRMNQNEIIDKDDFDILVDCDKIWNDIYVKINWRTWKLNK